MSLRCCERYFSRPPCRQTIGERPESSEAATSGMLQSGLGSRCLDVRAEKVVSLKSAKVSANTPESKHPEEREKLSLK